MKILHPDTYLSNTVIGVLQALLCATLLGAVPALSANAYHDGAEPLTLGACRGLAMILICLPAIRELNARHLDRQAFLTIAGLCVVYIAFIVLNQTAIVTAGVAKSLLLLFTHPLIVVFIQALRGREKLRWVHGVMCLASVCGIGIAADPWHGGMTIAGFMLGVGASLACSGVIIFYDEAGRRKISSRICTLVTGIAMFGVLAPAGAVFEAVALPHHLSGWIGLIGSSIGVSLGLMLFVLAIACLGTVRTILIGNIEPIIGLVFAALLAGERLSPNILAGGAIIITAAVDWPLVINAVRARYQGHPKTA